MAAERWDGLLTGARLATLDAAIGDGGSAAAPSDGASRYGLIEAGALGWRDGRPLAMALYYFNFSSWTGKR